MNSGIYCIVNLVNDKRYIGSSKNLKKRIYRWWYNLKHNKSSNPHLQSSYTIHGKENFQIYALEYCEIDKLIERETYWIELYSSYDREKGYNICKPDRSELSEETRAKISANHGSRRPEVRAKISASLRNRQLSEQHRENISEGLRGRVGWNKGIPLSESHKEKIANSNSGRVPSEEHKRKISIALRGIQRSEETKAKMSDAKRNMSEETRVKMSISAKEKWRKKKA